MVELYKQKFKKILFRVLGEQLFNKCVNLKLRIFNYDGREHIKEYGSLNCDKTIYVIRKSEGKEGLLSVLTYVMGRIDYADRNNMLPYVDIDTEGTPSIFDKYFKQKTSLTRDEVYKSKQVLLSGYDSKPVYPGWCNWINTEFNEQKRALFDKYIYFSDEVNQMAEKFRNYIEPKKCLGVYMRGTDYISLQPFGHPIQPSLTDVSDVIKSYLATEGLERIFLVTEDRNIYEQLVSCYGNKIIVVPEDKFWDEYKAGEMIINTISQNGSVEANNLLYLVKIILLSECHSFVGGRTNGSSVANALNGGKYKKRFVYDVGYYQ